MHKSPTNKSQPVDWGGCFWSFFTSPKIPTCHMTGWDFHLNALAGLITVKPEFEDLREPIEHKPNSRTSEFEVRQIKYDIGTKILTVRSSP